MKFIFSLLFLSFVLVSCDQNQESLKKNIEEKINSTIDEFSKSSPQAIEEVKKLSQLEYHMEVFPLEVEPLIVERKLFELGKERWDCFSSFGRPRSGANSPEMVVLCKRMPETMLRYVPRSFMGR